MPGEFALFQQLVANLQLPAAAVQDASGKHGRVRRCLNMHYYGMDSSTANSRLVGSYGKDTEIRPPSDIDILFQLPYAVWERINRRAGNRQSALLQEVKNVLAGSFPTTALRGDGQIVSVPFTSYEVEVLPAFLGENGSFIYGDSNGGGQWRQCDPVAEKDSLAASNARTGGKTIHLIKLAKAWKTVRGAAIKSFVLELLAVEFLDQWPWNVFNGTVTTFGYYDWMVRDFFTWLERRANAVLHTPGLFLPVTTGDAWVAQARFAANAAARAVEHHAADRPVSAKVEWQSVFGTYLP